MESERLRIFDGEHREIGTASREEIHKEGYWHETFQYWLLKKEENTVYIYFQIRSSMKKDFPSLLDITAAGHLLKDETAEDGIREVNEELGLDLTIHQVQPLGIIKESIELEGFLDREFRHVYMHQIEEEVNFTLQQEEVSGLVRAPFSLFQSFCFDQINFIEVEGFQINEAGEKEFVKKRADKQSFVPHSKAYWKQVAEAIGAKLSK
ncbi:NUDIX domain-containing protein [Domibacillus sp. 8LH]|uniref:NUDIX hydrolase n=1 Tax=Domibacillus sp. 8LH TaxID=3073900 RepID=UPI00316C2033